MAELRLFTAVRPPDSVLGEIDRYREQLADAIGSHAVRWVRRENYHVTLEFLGPTPESRVPEIEEAMRETAATVASPPALLLTRPGAFPGPRRPRTLWVGIRDVRGSLAELERDLRERLVRLGFALDEKPFRPHVTVGYVRKQASPADRASIAATLAAASESPEADGPGFTAGALLLVRSVAGPGGSRYTDLRTVRLG